MTFFYIDVSHYDRDRQNGPLNWAAIKQGGIDIMVARATYGDTSVYAPETRYYREMATGAKEAGFFLTGGYHNLIHGDAESMKRQVDWFRSELDATHADWAMLDVEPYTALQKLNLWPRYDDALRFRDRWYSVEPNRVLTFYIARWVWEGWLGRPDMTGLGGPLISARYDMGTKQGSPTELYEQSYADSGTGWQPYGGILPFAWQFTANALIPGKNGVTDVNAFKGTREDFKARVVKLPVPVVPGLTQYKNGSRELALKTPHMTGTDVKFVQSFIGATKCGPADGVFGSATKAGVIWYQGMRGLTKDGVVGPKTWAALLSKQAAKRR
jgi:GH25 family lysozyme M1 (1,4-beta-N-acetylmuramidase)